MKKKIFFMTSNQMYYDCNTKTVVLFVFLVRLQSPLQSCDWWKWFLVDINIQWYSLQHLIYIDSNHLSLASTHMCANVYVCVRASFSKRVSVCLCAYRLELRCHFFCFVFVWKVCSGRLAWAAYPFITYAFAFAIDIICINETTIRRIKLA